MTYHLVFDTTDPKSPRFIELEDSTGHSISAGEWRERKDGYVELVLPAPDSGNKEDLVRAVEKLYYSAYWTPDRECEAHKLWSDVGEAAGIASGQTITRLGQPRQHPEPVWQDIATAPRDGTPILVYYDDDSDPYHSEVEGRLTPYGTHAESGDFLDGRGVCIAIWHEGWFETTDEYGTGYHMPAWWFAWFNGDADLTLAPTHWMPLPFPPKPLSYEGEQS